jgi:hypothetical protein
MLALGKRPARDAVSFKFATYFDASALPVPPPMFGKPWLVTDWGLFKNDSVGDCVWCDAAHSVMLWRAEQGAPVQFSDDSVLSDYSAVTGYTLGDPSTDQGTDMQQAASYRLKTGVIDAARTRHKIDAYVALQPSDLDQLALATYLFGAVSIGIQLPSSAFDQFDQAVPWTVVDGSPVEGGHCITVVGRNSRRLFLGLSWGRLIGVAGDFLIRYMDEGIAAFSLERLRGSISPQGFDAATLQADLALLKAGPQPEKTAMAATSSTDPAGKLVAVKAAIQKVVNTFTYMGISVGSHITDEELTQVATAAIKAGDDFDNAPSI